MAWVKDEEKGIAQVDIPTETPPPAEKGMGFFDIHQRIKAVIDANGKVGKCSSVDDIMVATGYSETTILEHLDIFMLDAYVSPANFRFVCSTKSIDEMDKLLKKWRLGER